MDRDSAVPEVTTLPGPQASELVSRHHEHAAPATHEYEFVWDHDAPAIGPFCTDVDGNVLMDWTGQVASAPFGYNNPKITEPLGELDIREPMKIAGQDFYTDHGGASDPAIPGPTDLMERLADRSAHYDMDTVFLSNSGAEAVENAMKIGYDHSGGQYAITFEGAFHGRTLGALSVNRSKAKYRRGFPEVAGVHHVPFCQDRDCTPASCDCGFFGSETSALGRMLEEGHGFVDAGETAFLILEPVQGEGGYRFPSDAFMEEIVAVCEKEDILIVADEVQSGVGRTGSMWASDHYAIEPDVIASAKSLRVGATLANEAVFPDEQGRLSSTWGGGDILAAAQGAITLEAIDEYDLMDNAVTRGRQFIERFRDETAAMDAVVDVRGKGLLLGVEYATASLRDDVQETAFHSGFLTLGCGRKTMRLLPPLDSTAREIDLGIDLLIDAIKQAS
jgi:4-aminobutyrate aminotransferase